MVLMIERTAKLCYEVRTKMKKTLVFFTVKEINSSLFPLFNCPCFIDVGSNTKFKSFMLVTSALQCDVSSHARVSRDV